MSFIQDESEGFTQTGQLLLQEAIESYVYSILGSQARTRSKIVGAEQVEASSLPSFSKKKYFFPNTQVLGKRRYKMTEPTTQEQTPQVTVVKDDPTKVSKPPRDDPARITKNERSEKQKANDGDLPKWRLRGKIRG